MTINDEAFGNLEKLVRSLDKDVRKLELRNRALEAIIVLLLSKGFEANFILDQAEEKLTSQLSNDLGHMFEQHPDLSKNDHELLRLAIKNSLQQFGINFPK